MRILICGDVHWSQYSSILRKRGKKYSERLENLIKSINWVENTALNNKCSRVIYLGDFFDRPELNAEEISALKECRWSPLDHDFLVGNHEITRSDLSYNSTNVFQFLTHYKVHNEIDSILCNNCNIIMLPYAFDANRSSLSDVCKKYASEHNKTVICAHSDLKISYGQFNSTIGYDVADIESNCDLFINGHIHNGTNISDKVINVGNLTGQNFSEDAFNYNHRVMLLDTETLEYGFIVNPHAFNFYKIEGKDNLKKLLKSCSNAVISLSISEKDYNEVNSLLENSDNVATYRITVTKESLPNIVKDGEELHCDDHLEQFRNYIIDNMGSSEAVLYELSEICS